MAKFFAVCSIALLFAVSCGDNPTQPTAELTPSPMGDPAFAMADPDNLTGYHEPSPALGKANSSDCSNLNGWYHSGDTSPRYWYAHDFLRDGNCAKFYLGYTWKMSVWFKNLDQDESANIEVRNADGDTLYKGPVPPNTVGSTGWNVHGKGWYTVHRDDDARVGIVQVRITETWSNTD